ncbi:hypothetical protein SAMN05216349_1064 [Oribacterium sp. KHPX15]|uniref:hypothetical protein n=1 Tax=Oribacterium sp. KHPX15 TaxID=1855342 RepID=UPI000898DE07|nr:hypothetical protein [Oribacterium sp. KHPX15]SEA16950.1 hypothetical protein SAMN05216349_1064 [Oribacterium sp. KHPX15]
MGVFVVGGCKPELPEHFLETLDRLMEQENDFLIGESSRTDREIQKYLKGHNYKKAAVYRVGTTFRYNYLDWTIRNVNTKDKRGGQIWVERAFRMCEESDRGIIIRDIWDDTCWTFYFMAYMLAARKPCSVFLPKENRWIEIISPDDLIPFAGEQPKNVDSIVREILLVCGFSSDIIDYSISKNSISTRKLIDIICEAPISLYQKRNQLGHMMTMRNMDYDVFKVLSKDISEGKSIQEIKMDIRKLIYYEDELSDWTVLRNRYWELYDAWYTFHGPAGAIFTGSYYLFEEWYDLEEMRYVSFPVGMFFRVKDILEYIKNDKVNVVAEEVCYRVEMWNRNDPLWKCVRYDYYFYRGELCWFEV